MTPIGLCIRLHHFRTSPTLSAREAMMTLVLQPFLSETPAPSKPPRAPIGTFAVARVSRNTSAPWSPNARVAAAAGGEHLPQGVVAAPRRRMDMSRHATVVLA